jgi:hypothetical protein
MGKLNLTLSPASYLNSRTEGTGLVLLCTNYLLQPPTGHLSGSVSSVVSAQSTNPANPGTASPAPCDDTQPCSLCTSYVTAISCLVQARVPDHTKLPTHPPTPPPTHPPCPTHSPTHPSSQPGPTGRSEHHPPSSGDVTAVSCFVVQARVPAPLHTVVVRQLATALGLVEKEGQPQGLSPVPVSCR